MGLLGRPGISREGHGSLAGFPTNPAGCYTGAAGVVTEIQGGEGGGMWEKAVKLREVEDKAVGDYLAAKCTVGRPRWTSGLWSAVMPRVCYWTHIKIKTHVNKSTKYAHKGAHSLCNAEHCRPTAAETCKYAVSPSAHTLTLTLASPTQLAHFTDTYHK